MNHRANKSRNFNGVGVVTTGLYSQHILLKSLEITTFVKHQPNNLPVRIIYFILKISAVILFILLLFLGGVLLHNALSTSYLEIPQEEQHSKTVIKNVYVLPLTTDTVLPLQDVCFENGTITAIQPNIDTTNAHVIQGNKSYLMPGLIDMHVHVWDEQELALYLSHGITTVRNLWGFPMHLRMVENAKQKALYAATLYTSSPKLTGPEFIGDDNLNLYTEAEAKSKVAEYKSRGYHYIKTYYGLTAELFNAILQQAAESKIEVVAHPTPKVPYNQHFHSTICSIEHAEDIVQQPLNYQLDTAKLQTVVQEFAKAKHSALCPTLMAYYNIYNMLVDTQVLNAPSQQYMNPLIRLTDSKDQYNRWQSTQAYDDSTANRIYMQHQFHLYAIQQLHENGVKIIAGTDAGIGITAPGKSLYHELQFYRAAGLSNYEVLKTATINAASTHKNMAHLGSVEVGKTANLLLLNANPLNNLEALQQINTVVINGYSVTAKTKDQLRQKALNRSNLLATAFNYLEFLLVEK